MAARQAAESAVTTSFPARRAGCYPRRPMPVPIYLDNHATTRVDPRVCGAMAQWTDSLCGNPSSPHAAGSDARRALEQARADVAALAGAGAPGWVTFTPSATAANNLAIRGHLAAVPPARRAGRRVVVGEIEHKSVSEPARAAAAELGYEFAVAPVDEKGRLRLDALERLLQGAALASVQLANNEVGTVQDVRAAGLLAKAMGAVFHVDATQGAGKVEFDMRACMADLVSFAAHKMHGPKGAACLVADPSVPIRPLLLGGEQENKLWPGTQNVPAIVGFGEACRIAAEERVAEAARVGGLRNLLAELLAARLPGMRIVGPFVPGVTPDRRWPNRLPGNLSVMLPGKVHGRALVERLAGEVCISTGAACNCPKMRSAVLRSLGVRDEESDRVVRFGLGRFTTRDEVERAAALVASAAAA